MTRKPADRTRVTNDDRFQKRNSELRGESPRIIPHSVQVLLPTIVLPLIGRIFHTTAKWL